jgi:hypothetical protein
VREVEDLFSAVGVAPSAAEWQEISAAVDIGTDWLDRFAARTGLCGEELVAAARDSASMPSELRLRQHFQGPTGRPLVALLLGGDQWGQRARRLCGREASLLLWALTLRWARQTEEQDRIPPVPVVGAWVTTVRLISEAMTQRETATPDFGPTVAA